MADGTDRATHPPGRQSDRELRQLRRALGLERQRTLALSRELARQKRVEDSLRRSGERHLAGQSVLIRVSAEVMAGRRAEEVLQKAAAAVRELIACGAAACAWGYRDGAFRATAFDPSTGPPSISASVLAGLFQALHACEPIRQPGLRAVPLTGCNGKPNGLIVAGESTAGEGTAVWEEARLAELAAIISLALQHIAAHQEAERVIAERTAAAERHSRHLQALALQLTEVEEKERRRISTDLHDDLQQILASVSFQLSILQRADYSGEAGQGLLRQVGLLIDESLRKARRLSQDLSPAILYQSGLDAAAEWLARRMRETHGLAIEVETAGWCRREPGPLGTFLFRSIQELLLNVARHSGTDRARLTLRCREGRTEVTVSDTGRGFEPLRLKTTEGPPAVFGLFSIDERIRLLGGSMRIDSAPGRGCSVTLSVPDDQNRHDRNRSDRNRWAALEPLREPAPAAGARILVEGGADRPGGGVIRVLVADDHLLMRQGLAALLRGLPDIQVVGEAADGDEALERARQLAPDVVLMDVAMPRMDGIEATRRIKEELPGVRVIGLSMFEEAEVAEELRRAGAQAYLSKSGPSSTLLAAIRGR